MRQLIKNSKTEKPSTGLFHLSANVRPPDAAWRVLHLSWDPVADQGTGARDTLLWLEQGTRVLRLAQGSSARAGQETASVQGSVAACAADTQKGSWPPARG